MAMMKPVGRLWKWINTEGDCWLWTGASHGMRWAYPAATVLGKRTSVHRLVWSWFNGGAEVPKGRYICHHCDNPACVRPSHLYCGSPRDNAIDMVKRGRANPPRGEAHRSSKFTSGEILQIRAIYDASPIGTRLLAKAYGVRRNTIRAIVKHESWSHV